jgi:hypothetical protein
MITKIVCLACILILAVGSAEFFGQEPSLKTIAKAKRAAQVVDEKTLTAEITEAARGECAARMSEFLAGRGTLDILFGASLRQQAAEIQAATNQHQAVDALGGQWERAFLIETVNRHRYEGGRIPTKEYWASAANRLQTELTIAHEHAPEFPPGQGIALTEPWLAKDIAKTKRAALQADMERSKRQRLQFLELEFESRFKEFLAGRGTLDILQEVSRQWQDADLALAKDSRSRIAAFERHWEATRLIEVVNEARYQAERIPIQDNKQSVAARLDAEIRLCGRRDSGEGWKGGSKMTRYFFDIQEYDPWPLLVQWIARQKFAARHSDLKSLIEQRRRALETQYTARLTEFYIGRGTLDILLEAARNLFDAEFAAGLPHIDCQRNYWQRLLPIKLVNDQRYKAGRIPIQDKQQSTYFEREALRHLISSPGQ